MISAEGIMALHDPTLRALYDLKVSGMSDDPFMSQYLGCRCLSNVTQTLCLPDGSSETLKNVAEVLMAFWISELGFTKQLAMGFTEQSGISGL